MSFSFGARRALAALGTWIGLSPAPTVVPLAPTVVANSGNAQVQLTITDDPASVGVRKWGIYTSATSGGVYARRAWAYSRTQPFRKVLTNGTTEYYKVSAWNAIGEGPLSAEISASPLSTNLNLLRIIGVTLFVNTPFEEPFAMGEVKAGSTFTTTASDGTTLSTFTQNSCVFLKGTFATAGTKTLTITETPSVGSPKVTTQTIEVVARTSGAKANFTATATAAKARLDNKPTYAADGQITVTDNGSTKPTGLGYTFTYNGLANQGMSMRGDCLTVMGNTTPPSNSVTAYEPVEKTVDLTIGSGFSYAASNNTTNKVLRQRLFKQSFSVILQGASGTVGYQWKTRYSDDEMQTWHETTDPVFIKGGSGSHYYIISAATAAPAGGRIWEIELDNFSVFPNNPSTPGFGYLAGETPQAVVDNSPICLILVDSFANGVGCVDITKNMGRVAARLIGYLNLWNCGIPSHRYTLPASNIYPLGLNRIGDNSVGLGDLSNPPHVETVFLNWTINDNAQPNTTHLQTVMTNVLLRTRRILPNAMIVLTVGFWAPQDRLGTTNYNALKAAVTDAMTGDAGFIFNDGIAAGWAVAAGVTGSAGDLFLNSNGGAITATISGTTMTVTADPSWGNIEPGFGLCDASGVFIASNVYKQLTGTTGKAGTYQLTLSPTGGDIASPTSLTLYSEGSIGSYPVHPAPPGHVSFGGRLADGHTALVTSILA